LLLRVVLCLLPIGLMQARASVEHGRSYARSTGFIETRNGNHLRWMRMIGDSLFALGIAALGWFILAWLPGTHSTRAGEPKRGHGRCVPLLCRRRAQPPTENPPRSFRHAGATGRTRTCSSKLTRTL
jgi:hypothetical protein